MSKVRYCEICKCQIEAERLEAAADTRLCIQHAKDIEKFGGEFKTQASQERTSKAGSMKINYGGVSTSRIRNTQAIEKLKNEFAERDAPAK